MSWNVVDVVGFVPQERGFDGFACFFWALRGVSLMIFDMGSSHFRKYFALINNHPKQIHAFDRSYYSSLCE